MPTLAPAKPVMGRPRVYDRDAIGLAFEQYIEQTEIPILAEFATKHKLHKQFMYDCPEFADLVKRCLSKKESALERMAVAGNVNCAMAIFSLKQMGWSDRQDLTHKGDQSAPLVFSSIDQKL